MKLDCLSQHLDNERDEGYQMEIKFDQIYLSKPVHDEEDGVSMASRICVENTATYRRHFTARPCEGADGPTKHLHPRVLSVWHPAALCMGVLTCVC